MALFTSDKSRIEVCCCERRLDTHRKGPDRNLHLRFAYPDWVAAEQSRATHQSNEIVCPHHGLATANARVERPDAATSSARTAQNGRHAGSAPLWSASRAARTRY